MNDPERRDTPSLYLRLKLFAADGRRRAAALMIFPALFVLCSTLLIFSLRDRIFPPPPAAEQSLVAVAGDLHTLVSGSLILAGLHPEDILREETLDRHEGSLLWSEYQSEVLVADHFPLEGWLDGLANSLERAGARLHHSEGDNYHFIEVTYAVSGRDSPVPVESLKVRVRPSPEKMLRNISAENPRAAIVIDDLGQNPAHIRRLSDMGIPMTVSILPHLPYSRSTALRAAEANMEILLHLPMEPFDFPEKRPGPGALLVEMTDGEMREQLLKNFDVVPGAVGVNNHMGSRLTADGRAMEILMKELKKRGLLFLDSKTSPRSLAFDTAYQYNIPVAERDIFLDAFDDPAFIEGQTRKLMAAARRRGVAIGIGHPYDSTLEVLDRMKEEILASGIEWVHLSELVIQAYDGESR